MDALLDLIPMHLQVKREAKMDVITLKRDTAFKLRDLVGEILSKFCKIGKAGKTGRSYDTNILFWQAV